MCQLSPVDILGQIDPIFPVIAWELLAWGSLGDVDTYDMWEHGKGPFEILASLEGETQPAGNHLSGKTAGKTPAYCDSFRQPIDLRETELKAGNNGKRFTAMRITPAGLSRYAGACGVRRKEDDS